MFLFRSAGTPKLKILSHRISFHQGTLNLQPIVWSSKNAYGRFFVPEFGYSRCRDYMNVVTLR